MIFRPKKKHWLGAGPADVPTSSANTFGPTRSSSSSGPVFVGVVSVGIVFAGMGFVGKAGLNV